MWEGLLTYFNRASLCALFLTLRNFPQSHFQSKTKATRSFTDGNSPPYANRHVVLLYTLRGLLRCSSRLDRHVERPLGVGRARKVDPTFLFLYVLT